MLERVTLYASSPSSELLYGRHDILGAQTGHNDSQTSKVDEAVSAETYKSGEEFVGISR